MMPRIHIQLTASGRKESRLSSMRPNEIHRKKKTMKLQTSPTESKSSDNRDTSLFPTSLESNTNESEDVQA